MWHGRKNGKCSAARTSCVTQWPPRENSKMYATFWRIQTLFSPKFIFTVLTAQKTRLRSKYTFSLKVKYVYSTMQCKYSCSTKQQVSYSPRYGIHFLNCCVHARSRRIYNKTRNNSKPAAIQLRDAHKRIHFEQTWNAENSAWLSHWFWQAETNSIISVSRNSLLR